MLLSFDKPPDIPSGSVKEMSDSSRLRSLKSFFVKCVLYFVSMIVFRIEEKEVCVEAKK